MTNSGKYLIVGFLGIVGGGALGSVVEIMPGTLILVLSVYSH